MQPVSVTYTTTGVKEAYSVDWRIVPFRLSYAMVLSNGGAMNAWLEVTLDDVNNPNITPVWLVLTAVLSQSTIGSIEHPIQFVRANVSTLTGSVTLKLLQGESVN